jgi:hypothetical protein
LQILASGATFQRVSTFENGTEPVGAVGTVR